MDAPKAMWPGFFLSKSEIHKLYAGARVQVRREASKLIETRHLALLGKEQREKLYLLFIFTSYLRLYIKYIHKPKQFNFDTLEKI